MKHSLTKHSLTKRSLIAPILAATLLAGPLFVGSVASAQSALFASSNVSARVTFYSGDPASGAAALGSATVNNSPGAVTLQGISAARYATLVYEGQSYTFALAESGKNKNEVVLAVANATANTTDGAQLVSDSGTLTLAELLDGLAADPTLLEQLQTTPVS